MFIKQETVYGGEQGLKLYIRTQVTNWYICLKIAEHTLTNIALDNIYVPRNHNISISFRQISMYGTLCNYKWYGLDTNSYDGACVPRHLLETYNN